MISCLQFWNKKQVVCNNKPYHSTWMVEWREALMPAADMPWHDGSAAMPAAQHNIAPPGQAQGIINQVDTTWSWQIDSGLCPTRLIYYVLYANVLSCLIGLDLWQSIGYVDPLLSLCTLLKFWLLIRGALFSITVTC